MFQDDWRLRIDGDGGGGWATFFSLRKFCKLVAGGGLVGMEGHWVIGFIWW